MEWLPLPKVPKLPKLKDNTKLQTSLEVTLVVTGSWIYQSHEIFLSNPWEFVTPSLLYPILCSSQRRSESGRGEWITSCDSSNTSFFLACLIGKKLFLILNKNLFPSNSASAVQVPFRESMTEIVPTPHHHHSVIQLFLLQLQHPLSHSSCDLVPLRSKSQIPIPERPGPCRGQYAHSACTNSGMVQYHIAVLLLLGSYSTYNIFNLWFPNTCGWNKSCRLAQTPAVRPSSTSLDSNWPRCLISALLLSQSLEIVPQTLWGWAVFCIKFPVTPPLLWSMNWSMLCVEHLALEGEHGECDERLPLRGKVRHTLQS